MSETAKAKGLPDPAAESPRKKRKRDENLPTAPAEPTSDELLNLSSKGMNDNIMTEAEDLEDQKAETLSQKTHKTTDGPADLKASKDLDNIAIEQLSTEGVRSQEDCDVAQNSVMNEADNKREDTSGLGKVLDDGEGQVSEPERMQIDQPDHQRIQCDQPDQSKLMSQDINGQQLAESETNLEHSRKVESEATKTQALPSLTGDGENAVPSNIRALDAKGKNTERQKSKDSKQHYPDLNKERVTGDRSWYCLVKLIGDSPSSMVRS